MIKRKISNVSRIKNLVPIILFVLFYFPISFPQDFSINKIEPPNWWVGMKWNTVQLMVYGENLDDVSVSTSYPGNNVIKTHSVENKNYLFVDIEIPNDLPDGDYELIFRKGNEIVRYNYPILNRELAPEDHNGFSNEDVIYLIFADRFCDGNP